jgi:hypothetical protein
VHVTHDGGRGWRDVTPPALTPWSKVSMLEASHFDTLVAYAAVNRFRLDDVAPHIWRTRDGGAHWAEIVSGIGPHEVVNSVREDPAVKGMLFAATERTVYASFDDGDHWQSLRLNLPSTSVRDLVVHDRDLVIGTHGRSFWILDDITPLREARAALASTGGYLCAPAPALRVRANRNTDTPMPPDEPTGQNPPDGAVLDYWFPEAPRGEVTLEVLDAAGELVRRFSSADPPDSLPTGLQVPTYWMRRPRPLPAAAGMNRFVWDLHAAPLPGIRRDYPISATPEDTPAEPRGPWVLPGEYRVRLESGGRSFERPLSVRMDPRVKTPAAGLRRQHELSVQLAAAMRRDSTLAARVRERAGAGGAPASPDLAELLGSERRERGPDAAGGAHTADLGRAMSQLVRLYEMVQETDAPPTPAVETAARGVLADLDVLQVRCEKALGPKPPGH